MSWDEDLIEAWGAAMGAEQAAKGTNVMLGPAVNLARVPWAGRNFEYMGEDPVLAGRMVAREVAGIQSNNISGCIKHWVNNNQEHDRRGVSEVVGQRTAFETYYAPFAAAVDAGVGSAMCSYNRINGTWACENNETLSILKHTLGFDGWVMSDWGATHSTVPAALAGLDQEFQFGIYFSGALAKAVASGAVPASRLDDMVTRMLVPMTALGLIEHPPKGNILANATSPAHAALARELAEQSAVLLQNKGNVLPLDATKLRSILVLGDNDTVACGGSGHVNSEYIVSPYQGISAYLAAHAPSVAVSYYSGADAARAAALAAAADAAIVVVATTSSEGSDRTNLSLPLWQDELAAAVAAAQAATVVVARCPGACVMPWAPAAAGILFQLMGGQEAGSALANLLFGAVNPSGKLPLSFPASMTDTWLGDPVNPAQYPGVDVGGILTAHYTEGVFFGYRWYDAQGTAPLWPFGHGLSYSTFAYSNLTVTGGPVSAAGANATVSFTVTNAGGAAGAEVAQLYVGFPAAAGEPPQLLRDFAKVKLDPGASVGVSFTVTAAQLSIWDVTTAAWALTPGTYAVRVGSSSRDIRLTGSLTAAALL